MSARDCEDGSTTTQPVVHSSTRLPNLESLASAPLGAPKRRRYELDTIWEGDLAYGVGERLGIGRNRVQGGSAHFTKEPMEADPNVDSVERALTAVAKEEGSDERVCKPRTFGRKYEGVEEGFIRVERAIPQYYVKELKSPATVVHILNDSLSAEDLVCPSTTKLFTGGVLWTNANPNWNWQAPTESNVEWKIRCRILVPSGTQVIVDRHPVSLVNGSWFPRNAAVLEQTADGKVKVAPFPDVLLTPGEFERTSIRHYRKIGEQLDIFRLEDANVVYADAVEVDTSRDLDLARMLCGCDFFTEITLTLVRSRDGGPNMSL